MKKSFITGLVILLPVAVTIAILMFIVNFLTDPFAGLVKNIFTYFNIPGSDTSLLYLSQLIILIALFFLIVLIGFSARMFFIHYLIKISDFILLRIPFVSALYKATSEIIRTLFYSPTKSFKQVVLVPFPSKESYTLGLITGEGLAICKNALEDEIVSVFVPTTPNPTGGYLLMFKTKDIIHIDMRVEDALKYIISCGVLSNEPKANNQIV